MGKMKVVCAGCGTQSRQEMYKYINPKNTPMPDLDLRPAGKQRNSFKALIQECPSCGYCAQDISVKPENLNQIMENDEYLVLVKSKYFSAESKKYLKSAITSQLSGRYDIAIKSFIYSAWVCDDENNDTGARLSRQMALGGFMSVREIESEQYYFKTSFRNECLITDLLRRAGSLGEARNRCNRVLADIKEDKDIYEIPRSQPNTIEEETLLFQQKLIADKDRSCHSFNEFSYKEPERNPDEIGGYENDPIEDDPRYWEIMQQVDEEVANTHNPERKMYMGYCHVFWGEKQKLLKKRYGIKWLSPADLNPGVMYD